MTLIEEDVERLEGLGHRGFWRQLEDGSLVLVNLEGQCFFLADGKCLVYEHRPEGCVLYPLILDLDSGSPVRDEFCPHREEFRFSSRDERRLRRSVEIEEREANARRR
jgi:Fe-S-cluster containining protein